MKNSWMKLFYIHRKILYMYIYMYVPLATVLFFPMQMVKMCLSGHTQFQFFSYN